MVTAPDNVAELLFTGRPVEESKLARPNLIENHATWSGLDGFCLCIAVDGFSPKIAVLDADPVVRANAALAHGEFHFGCISEERKPLAVLTMTSGILGEVVTAERDVLGRRRNGLAAGRRENVVRSEHEHARFHLRLN